MSSSSVGERLVSTLLVSCALVSNGSRQDWRNHPAKRRPTPPASFRPQEGSFAVEAHDFPAGGIVAAQALELFDAQSGADFVDPEIVPQGQDVVGVGVTLVGKAVILRLGGGVLASGLGAHGCLDASDS